MTSTSEAISIQCRCDRRGRVSAHLTGRQARCTGCGEGVRVPTPAEQAARAQARARVAALAATPAKPGDELELLPVMERRAPDWEARLSPAARAEARGQAGADHGTRPRARRGRGHEEGRRDVEVEAHLRAMSLWQIGSSALGALGALGLGVAGLTAHAPVTALLVLVGGLLALSAAGGALGYFLWTYHAPARLVWLALTGLACLGNLTQLVAAPGVAAKLIVMIAMAWPAAMFLVLVGPRAGHICTPDYRALVRRTPTVSVRWYLSPFFYLPILIAAAGFVAVFGLSAAVLGAARF